MGSHRQSLKSSQKMHVIKNYACISKSFIFSFVQEIPEGSLYTRSMGLRFALLSQLYSLHVFLSTESFKHQGIKGPGIQNISAPQTHSLGGRRDTCQRKTYDTSIHSIKSLSFTGDKSNLGATRIPKKTAK